VKCQDKDCSQGSAKAETVSTRSFWRALSASSGHSAFAGERQDSKCQHKDLLARAEREQRTQR